MHFGGTCRGRSARGTPRGALLVACALGHDSNNFIASLPAVSGQYAGRSSSAQRTTSFAAYCVGGEILFFASRSLRRAWVPPWGTLWIFWHWMLQFAPSHRMWQELGYLRRFLPRRLLRHPCVDLHPLLHQSAGRSRCFRGRRRQFRFIPGRLTST